jgi:glycerophosphoryl diester phosphodiesterase
VSRPVTGFDYLDAVLNSSVLAMAHRGGAGDPDLLGLENSMAAFGHAASLGYDYLETDVHLTADGDLVAFHDDVWDRVTDATGPVSASTVAQVAQIRIGGTEPVPLLADLLEEFPGARINIDLKADGTAEALADLLSATRAADRVCVGSFSATRLNAFRASTRGKVATSASPIEVGAFLAMPVGRAARILTGGRVVALQVPHRHGRLPIVTAGLVRRAHAAGAHVHVWTVNDPAEMVELLDLGVDGLISDRTDLLKDLLVSRGQWSGNPVLPGS